MYALRLFGGIALEGPEGLLSGYATQSRQLALLALLGTAGDAGFSRDKLCAYLWPEATEDSARHSLRDAVYRLRRELGRDAVLGDAVTLRLSLDLIRCDVGEFEAAVDAGDLERAAERYRGAFLRGFHLRESAEFEQWQDGEARRLATMFEGLMATLATRAGSAGDHVAAVEHWRRLAEHDPFNSRFALRLMRAEADAGDPGNAVLYARAHTELLRRELGVEPPDELVELAERLQTAHAHSTEPAADPGTPRIPRLPLPGGARPRGLRRVAAGAGAVALAGMIGIWLWQGRDDAAPGGTEGTAVAGEAASERLLVVPLANLTDDPEVDLWGTLAATWTARAIDRARPLDVVPATSVLDALRALGDTPSLATLADYTGATYAVAGTVARTGDQVRFEVEFVDVRNGERLRTLAPLTGPADSVEAVVGRLADRAAAAAMQLFDPEAPWMVAATSTPPSVELFRQLLDQAELFCQGRFQESIEVGDQILAEAPDYAAALAYNWVAYSNLGRSAEVDSITPMLRESRPEYTRWERALFDWMIGNIYGDPRLATRAVDEMYRLDPRAFSYHAGLTYVKTGRVSEALERLRSYDVDRPCSRDWVSYWTLSAKAHHLLGRYTEELEVARRGLERFPADRWLMDHEIYAFVGMGRLDAVDSVLDVMAGLPPRSGFDPGVRPLQAGLELLAHGHPEEAEVAFRRALEWFAALPPSESRYNRGRALYYAGRWSDADTLFAALTEEAPDTRDYADVKEPGSLGVLGRDLDVAVLRFLGASLARLGRREEAMELSRRLGALDGPGLAGQHIASQAVIAAALGDRDEAVRLLQEAFENGQFDRTSIHVEPAFDGMRGYPPWEALVEVR